MFRRFYIGSTVEEELAFSNFYHSHRANRFIHQISLVIQSVLLPNLLTNAAESKFAGLAFAAIYFLPNSSVNVPSALLYFALMVGGALLPRQGSLIAGTSRRQVAAVIICLISQGAGHLCFQGARPAFRLFEAAVSTPVLMGMYCLRAIGYECENLKAVQSLTKIWANQHLPQHE